MAKTKMIPLYGNILVRPYLTEEITPGGIIIPDTAQKRRGDGVVIAVGKGEYNKLTGVITPMCVKVGDHVVFHEEYAGTKVEVGGEILLHMKETEVFCILEEEDE
jgi:chaperonin GroES